MCLATTSVMSLSGIITIRIAVAVTMSKITLMICLGEAVEDAGDEEAEVRDRDRERQTERESERQTSTETNTEAHETDN